MGSQYTVDAQAQKTTDLNLVMRKWSAFFEVIMVNTLHTDTHTQFSEILNLKVILEFTQFNSKSNMKISLLNSIPHRSQHIKCKHIWSISVFAQACNYGHTCSTTTNCDLVTMWICYLAHINGTTFCSWVHNKNCNHPFDLVLQSASVIIK